MGRRGKRKRIARNIYEDKSGRSGVVRVGEWTKEKRFPSFTPLATIHAWQEKTHRRLAKLVPAHAPRGTLSADVDRYLSMVRHLVGWVSLRSELRKWVDLYGDRYRHALNEQDVMQARNRWLDAKVKPKTINNRVTALNRLWHRLDGRRAISPAADVPPLPVHKTPPVVISPEIVRHVHDELAKQEQAGKLRDAKTRARFMIYATSGKRPSEIKRAQPTDVDLERRIWLVRDGKGGWSPGVYLNDDMLAAWVLFIAVDAWGPFNTGSLARVLRTSGWPIGVRPYNLRHTIGITMSELGVDLADIQQHMGHKRIETTRRHYVPVLGSRLQAASELVGNRIGWGKKR